MDEEPRVPLFFVTVCTCAVPELRFKSRICLRCGGYVPAQLLPDSDEPEPPDAISFDSASPLLHFAEGAMVGFGAAAILFSLGIWHGWMLLVFLFAIAAVLIGIAVFDSREKGGERDDSRRAVQPHAPPDRYSADGADWGDWH